MTGNARAVLEYRIAAGFNQRENLFHGRFCRRSAPRRSGPFFPEFLRACFCQQFESGSDSHPCCELICRVTSIILRVRIHTLREQPFHHAIAIHAGFHREHGLHQESKALPVR